MKRKADITQFTGKVVKNPVKAIREKCIDCCCGDKIEVKECNCTDCPCWPFRFGTNPFRTKKKEEE